MRSIASKYLIPIGRGSKKRTGRFLLFFPILILLACCARVPREIELIRSQELMSTEVTITLTGTDKIKLGDLADETFAFMQGLSSRFNIYDPASEVSRLNAAVFGKPVRVSPELADVLRAAAAAHQNTNGYFDITVRPLVLLWREAKRSGTLPTAKEIQKARSLVGFANVSLSGDAVTFLKPAISVDLGGIAKGYVVHRTTEYLKQRGVFAPRSSSIRVTERTGGTSSGTSTNTTTAATRSTCASRTTGTRTRMRRREISSPRTGGG